MNFYKKKGKLLLVFTSRIKCYQSELFHRQDKGEPIQLVKIYCNNGQTQLAGEIKCLDSYFLTEKGKQT